MKANAGVLENKNKNYKQDQTGGIKDSIIWKNIASKTFL